MSRPKLTPEQIREFLKGLTVLSREHGIVVTACSCCEGINLDPLCNTGGDGYTSADDTYVCWKDYWEES